MTTVIRVWPTRVVANFGGKTGDIALDQVRAIDKSRLVKRLGSIDAKTATQILECLAEMFAP
jgi:mRNA interferase MazF